MARKSRSDSIDSAVKAKSLKPPSPPSGMQLNDEEMACWQQMITVRQDWRDFDLVLMVKVVRLEVKLRHWWDMLDKSGPMVRNKRETLIEIPILRSIDTLQRQQLAIITKMQLMTVADPRTLNKAAQATDMEEIKKGNVLQLLAR